jgi:hypothetical protein
MDLKVRFSLSREELDQYGAFTSVVKIAVIRDVLNGIIPSKLEVDGNLPINLHKSEQLVWVFYGTEFLEDKTHRQYVGESSGVSIRIMRGVYYRTGAFKGEAVNRTERIHVDTGLLAITNKHIYFSGEAKGTLCEGFGLPSV